MVVKSQIKLIKSLQQKKYRIQHGMFVVEGVKTVKELLNSHFKAHNIYTTDRMAFENSSDIAMQISVPELRQMSGLKNPNTTLGVFYMPEPVAVETLDWVVALDDVRDPGNLGTIIRLCDWFGIQHLVCSLNTVDCFNPKVLQATMGSITRVNINYTDLSEFLTNSKTPVYGAFMNGENVYSATLPNSGVLIMGNEANGVSEKIEALISSKISIPQFGSQSAESLNVATATAILLSEVRRK